MTSRGIGIAAVTALMGLQACLLQLERDIACGDGFVDETAGEECDPADLRSFENGCAGTSRPEGIAACEPTTCTLINTKEQCATCGDGIVDLDLDEECDGDNFFGRVCPGGNGELQCGPNCEFDFSECDTCGNGDLDEGEECDPAQGGGFVTTRPCAGANLGEPNEVPPLTSPFANKPFTSGQTASCGDDCRLNRLNCGYCGNGTREDATPVDVGLTIPAEWCDGSNFDSARLEDVIGTPCADLPGTRPNIPCGDNCLSFGPPRPDAPQCCLQKNERCPDESDPLQCCYGYDHPNEDPCGEIFEGVSVREVCR